MGYRVLRYPAVSHLSPVVLRGLEPVFQALLCHKQWCVCSKSVLEVSPKATDLARVQRTTNRLSPSPCKVESSSRIHSYSSPFKDKKAWLNRCFSYQSLLSRKSTRVSFVSIRHAVNVCYSSVYVIHTPEGGCPARRCLFNNYYSSQSGFKSLESDCGKIILWDQINFFKNSTG